MRLSGTDRISRSPPAYGLCPQIRSADTAGHAIAITADERASQLRLARQAAAHFHITSDAATSIIEEAEESIRTQWDECCDLARLARAERGQLMGREFFNPDIYYDGA